MTGSTFESDLQRLLTEEPFVRRLARGLLFDEHRADDVVQETWIAALCNPPRAAAVGAAGLRGWIAGVVRRLVANHVRSEVRRRRREATVVGGGEAGSADQTLAREELRRQVVEALQALGEPYRTVVALRYLEGLEPAVIASRLAMPAATVRTQVRRGLEQMRERLDRRHGGDRGAWCLPLAPLVGVPIESSGRGATAALGANKLLLSTVAAAALLLGTWAWWPEPARLAPDPGERTFSRVAASAVSAPLPAEAGERVVVAPPIDAPSSFHGSLRGRLLGPDRQPLAAARLAAFVFDGAHLFGGAAELSIDQQSTAADGTFVLQGLPLHAGIVMLADAEGALRQLVPLAETPAPGRVVELGDVVLDPRGELTGAVVDEDGDPVAGAEVWAADLPAVVRGALAVEWLDVAHGLLLAVPRPGRPQCADPGAWQDTIRDHLTFRVTTTDYGRLPDDAWTPVVLDTTPLTSPWQLLPFARATTDGDGRFRLRGVAFGDNVLVARKPGRSPAARQRVAVRDVAPRDVGDLQLTAGGTVTGLVVDATGVPVAGAEVRVAPLGPFGFRGLAPCSGPAITDVLGRFVVPGMSRGKVLVAWRGAGGQPWRVCGPVDADRELSLSLPASLPVTMRLHVPEGLDATMVRIWSRPTPPLGEVSRVGCAGAFAPVLATGDPGTPATVLLAPGVHTLRLELAGAAPIHRVVDVGADVGTLDLVFARTHELAVSVQDSTGQPVAGAEVFVQAAGDPDARSVLAARYGIGTFDDPWPLPPRCSDAAGRVVLRVPPGRLRVSARLGSRGAAAASVDVTGDTLATLRLGGTGGIVGRVGIGPAVTGRPCDYRVTARLLGQQPDRSPVVDVPGARPGPDGSFRLDGLVPGRYSVRLWDPLPRSWTFPSLVSAVRERLGFGPTSLQEVTVDVGAGCCCEVAFAVGGLERALGSVRGVAWLDGRPAAGCTVWFRDCERRADGCLVDAGWEGRARARVGPEGDFLVADLPARRCWLGLREGVDGEFLHVLEVDVVAGAPVSVQLDVRLGRVRGRILRHDGTPLAHARVLVQRDASSIRAELRGVDTDADGRFVVERLPVGEHGLRVETRHDRLDGVPVAVSAGDATPPLELMCRPVHRLRVRLAADVQVPPNDMLLFGLRRPGQEGFSSHAGQAREQEFALDTAGDYEVVLRIGGTWTIAAPAPIRVQQLDEVVEVRPGTPWQPR